MTDLRLTHLAIYFSQTFMFSCPRGNPSNRYLPAKLRLSIFSLISLTMSSLEINFPSFMMPSSYFPSLDPVFTSSLSRSPVERCTKLYFLTRTSHWLSDISVTFPFLTRDRPRRIAFQQDEEDVCSWQLVDPWVNYKPRLCSWWHRPWCNYFSLRNF